MPRTKTNSSAKKRFKVTSSGKFKHKKAYKRHLLSKKSKRRKNRLQPSAMVHHSDAYKVKELMQA